MAHENLSRETKTEDSLYDLREAIRNIFGKRSSFPQTLWPAQVLRNMNYLAFAAMANKIAAKKVIILLFRGAPFAEESLRVFSLGTPIS
jgi:hypothetical protein